MKKGRRAGSKERKIGRRERIKRMELNGEREAKQEREERRGH